MRYLLVILLAASTVQIAFSQAKWRYSLGIGPNISKLFLEKPDVIYLETYHAQPGLNVGTKVTYQLNPSFKISLEPGFSIMGSKDNFDLRTSTAYLNIPLKIEYNFLKRFSVNAGISYQHLLKMLLSKGEDNADLTGFANHRNFLNPVLGVSYHLNRNFSFELCGVYATKDLFNAGAEDLNGNIIGPLKTYNHALSFTIWFTLVKPGQL